MEYADKKLNKKLDCFPFTDKMKEYTFATAHT